MRLAPGGLLWLIRHEARLALRHGPVPRARWRRLALGALVAAGPVAAGIAGALALGAFGGTPDSPRAILIVSLALLALALAMTPAAATQVLRTFHERADLDLLLSAPLPPPRVLAAKSLGAVLFVALPFLILLGPFLVASAILVHPRWLGGLALLAALAFLVTAATFVVVRALRRAIGVRRARVLVQVGAGIVGAAIFLVFQLQTFAPETAERVGRWLATARVRPILDWPARAALGQAGPLLAIGVAAALAGWAALRIAAGALFEPPEGESARRGAAVTAPRFRGGLTRAVVAKEWRLLARDPELLAQVTLRLVFLLPALALLLRGEGGGSARIAGAATALGGFLASSLAWLTHAAEDSRDLLRAAPVPQAALFRAKLAAATLPPLGFVFTGAVAAGGWAVWVTLVLGALAVLSAALFQAWHAPPAPRATFRRRQRGGLLLGFAELVMIAGWSAAAALLAQGSPFALFPLILASALFYAAWDSRPAA